MWLNSLFYVRHLNYSWRQLIKFIRNWIDINLFQHFTQTPILVDVVPLLFNILMRQIFFSLRLYILYWDDGWEAEKCFLISIFSIAFPWMMVMMLKIIFDRWLSMMLFNIFSVMSKIEGGKSPFTLLPCPCCFPWTLLFFCLIPLSILKYLI